MFMMKFKQIGISSNFIINLLKGIKILIVKYQLTLEKATIIYQFQLL